MRQTFKIPYHGVLHDIDMMSIGWELWIVQADLDMVVFKAQSDLGTRKEFMDLVSKKRQIHSEIRRMIGIYPDNMIYV